MYTKVLSLVLGLFLSGCTTYGRLEPVKREGQELYFHKGAGVVSSIRPKATIRIRSAKEVHAVGDYLFFNFQIKNTSDKVFDVALDNISASDGSKYASIISAEKLISEANKRAAWKSIAIAFQEGLDKQNAENNAYASFSGVASSNYRTDYGDVRGNSTYHGTIYDPAKAEAGKIAASREARIRQEKLTTTVSAEVEDINSSILSRTTLNPGQLIESFFSVAMPAGEADGKPVWVMFDIEGERHLFNFRQVIVK